MLGIRQGIFWISLYFSRLSKPNQSKSHKWLNECVVDSVEYFWPRNPTVVTVQTMDNLRSNSEHTIDNFQVFFFFFNPTFVILQNCGWKQIVLDRPATAMYPVYMCVCAVLCVCLNHIEIFTAAALFLLHAQFCCKIYTFRCCVLFLYYLSMLRVCRRRR